MRLLLLAAGACLVAHADVTLRYKIDAPMLPPAVDADPVLRVKGAKAATTIGRLTAIVDSAAGQVTLIDPYRKLYGAMPLAEFAAIRPQNRPPSPKFDPNSRKTGRTAAISGVETAEIEFSSDAGTVRAWTAAKLRAPALTAWIRYFLDLDVPLSDAVTVRLELEIRPYRMRLEATDVSTAALSDAAFRIPAGFTNAVAADLLTSATDLQPGPVESAVKAFIPNLVPTEMPRAGRGAGSVRLIVAIDGEGRVIAAEPIAGPDALRRRALNAVRRYRYRPVLRAGKPVVAMTQTSVYFGPSGAPDLSEAIAAARRVEALETRFPRTAGQVLADLEQDAGNAPGFRIGDLALAALEAGDLAKAETYAKEALDARTEDWNTGNLTHYGHIVLGRIALRKGDTARASAELIAAGKTSGSPQLGSFGPDLELARALLESGQTAPVLEYLEECRVFWKMGAARLDSWTEAIRAGRKPTW